MRRRPSEFSKTVVIPQVAKKVEVRKKDTLITIRREEHCKTESRRAYRKNTL